VADRLAETLRRVLHARVERTKPQSRRAAADPLVVDGANSEHGESGQDATGQQECQRTVGRTAGREGASSHHLRSVLAELSGEQGPAHLVEFTDHLHRQDAERDARERQPHEAGALEGTGVVGLREIRFARLPEEITPKNFTIT